MMPERPPTVKVPMNPAANFIAVVKRIDPPHMVPIQLKIFTPVGTPIRKLPVAKAVLAMSPIPVANMWCAHTVNPRNPMATLE